jgi:hypothetical protein
MTPEEPRFALPCTFTVTLSLQHPVSYFEEDGTKQHDTSRLLYCAHLEAKGKHIAIESPPFTAQVGESQQAFSILSDLLNYTLASSVLGRKQQPQYEFINDVLRPVSDPLNHEC